jgi:adenosylmethionine-8-amino-7-oxononanoate aminotransferase
LAGSTTTAATEHKAHEDERYGLDPDLVTLAKGVTSGYAPPGGVLLSARIWQPFYRDSEQTPIFQQGATCVGHAIASALALGLTSTTQLLTSDPAARAAAHEAVTRIGGGRAGARGTIDVHDPSLLGTVTVSGPGAGRIETAYALLSDVIATTSATPTTAPRPRAPL